MIHDVSHIKYLLVVWHTCQIHVCANTANPSLCYCYKKLSTLFTSHRIRFICPASLLRAKYSFTFDDSGLVYELGATDNFQACVTYLINIISTSSKVYLHFFFSSIIIILIQTRLTLYDACFQYSRLSIFKLLSATKTCHECWMCKNNIQYLL